jgi:hypothetical protein
MSEPQSTALSVQTETGRGVSVNIFQAAVGASSRISIWAVDTAQQFGSLVSVLMGPAIFTAYAFAAWSLASDLGWTGTFPYESGPLSNWLIWSGMAILTHVAANVLKRCTFSAK